MFEGKYRHVGSWNRKTAKGKVWKLDKHIITDYNAHSVKCVGGESSQYGYLIDSQVYT